MSSTAARRKWAAANPEKVKAARKRWSDANPERVRNNLNAWRRANQRHVKAWRRRWTAANRERLRAKDAARGPQKVRVAATKRKTVLGRVCSSCGRRDDETIWSGRQDACGTCQVRGHKNGWCEGCGEARYKVGLGTRGREHPCSCALSGEAPSEPVLLLWDLLRFEDRLAVSLVELADRAGLTIRTIQRMRARFLDVIRGFDPDVRFERDQSLPGGPATIYMDTPRVRRGLNALVNATASA